MEFIHEFWTEMFPMFVEYEFIYVFFDVCTVLTLLTLLFEVPSLILFGNSRKVFKI